MRKKVFLNRSFDILPHEHVEKKVNEYALFMKEYENSNKYRLICSFRPICSNILFNTITEIVGDEGSDKCVFYGLNGPSVVNDTDLNNYLKYTNRNIRDKYNKFVYLTRAKMIEDTGYSHQKCGNIAYHCGYDIFNNHILRSKDFIVINKMNSGYDNNKRPLFNTLSDYLRDAKGDIKTELNVKDETSENVKEKRVYVGDSISNYFNTITENLTEIDGWIGFKNKVFLNIPNYGDNISINKVINNKSIGEFIDMYPDKTLFSILPKYNSYRDRYENNWEFCLTYPYANDEMHDLVNYQYTNNGVVYNYNGIECIFKLDDVLQIGDAIDTRLITLRTFVEHGLVNGDEIKISVFYYNEDKGVTYTYETPNVCRVFGVGNTSYEKKQYFKIRIQDIQNLILNLMVYGVGTVNIKEDADGTLSFDPFALDIDFFEIKGIKFRFTKVVGGRKSKYYLRKFKRLTTKDDAEYAYTLNKVAYSTTIFKERCGEIIFDEIIDVEGILDNNGRQLNEIYLTTFKTNYGYEEWYYNKNYTGETVEFSHCFGELSSGFDLPSDELCKDYNVHALHNIDDYIDYYSKTNKESYPKSGKPLNKGLSKSKTIEFYGDLVEFNENSLQENILEEVYFRFNTAQREFYEKGNEEFNTIKYSEIIVDDEDCNESFRIEERDIRVDNENNVDTNLHININPEGYIYKPNYRFLLKEYDENVYWGNDTYIELLTINYTNYISSGSTFNNITVGEDMYEYEITCNEKILSEKYIYLNVYDKIYLTNKQNFSEMTYGVITHVDLKEKKYRFIINIKDLDKPLGKKRSTSKIIDNYLFFRENPLKPKNVYMFKDGSGVYNWREFKKHSNIEQNSPLYQRPFVNGTHYLYKDIDFYLKRQDPNGLFMLSFNSDMQLSKINLTILGNQKDVSNNNYVKTMEPTLC